jgi:hypothetical protein
MELGRNLLTSAEEGTQENCLDVEEAQEQEIYPATWAGR